jgi:hypothetical protein
MKQNVVLQMLAQGQGKNPALIPLLEDITYHRSNYN